MEAKYILEYSDFPSQKVLGNIYESEKDITDAFARRNPLQQGYQSELRTLFKPITEEIKKLPLGSKLATKINKIDEGATQENINELREQQTRIVSILDAIKKSSKLKDVMILVSKRPNVKRWLADEDVELDETDQSALRVLNKLSTDKLDVVNE